MLRVERIFEADAIEDEIAVLQSADSRRQQLESDVHDRIRRRRRTSRRACSFDRRRTSRVGRCRRQRTAYLRSPTKICRAATTKKPPRYISCASISTPQLDRSRKIRRADRHRNRSSSSCSIASIRCRKPPREPRRRSRMNTLMSSLGERIARYVAAPAKYYKPTVITGGAARWPEFIQPCDVLLVEGSSRISTAIKYLTQSTWSHSAICVGDAARRRLVEADVESGVSAVAFEKYFDANVRICRPVGLSRGGSRRD